MPPVNTIIKLTGRLHKYDDISGLFRGLGKYYKAYILIVKHIACKQEF